VCRCVCVCVAGGWPKETSGTMPTQTYELTRSTHAAHTQHTSNTPHLYFAL
jgi:hypothetical protein